MHHGSTHAAADTDTATADEVLRAVRRIIHALDVQSKRLTRETGLSAAQFVVLRAVRELGEVTTRSVSRHVSLTQPTVTQILDRLAARGLIERYRSAQDRRVVHTRLTEAGEATLEDAPPLLQERFVKNFDGLPTDRRRDIVAALEDVARMMGAEGYDAPPILPVASLDVTR